MAPLLTSPIRADRLIIGDVHGEYDLLQQLLTKAGFGVVHDLWQHPETKSVFLGDVIERGPQTPQVVRMVRQMVEHDKAVMIAGNHEVDMCVYQGLKKLGVKESDLPFSAARKKMIVQVGLQYKRLYGSKFRAEIESDLDFLAQLPLFLDEGDYRAVHACWDQNNIDILDAIGTKKSIDLAIKDAVDNIGVPSKERRFDRSMPLYKTVCGKNYRLEKLTDYDAMLSNEDYTYLDTRMQPRSTSRIKWWAENKKTIDKLSDVLFVPDDFLTDKTKKTADLLRAFHKNWRHATDHDKNPSPIFFGHYHLGDTPHLLDKKHACLDFGQEHYLTAYTWHKGDAKLAAKNLLWVR